MSSSIRKTWRKRLWRFSIQSRTGFEPTSYRLDEMMRFARKPKKTSPEGGAVRTLIGAILLTIVNLSSGAPTPPNIVLIVADDLGYGDLGCYGSKVSKTPHIDKLAGSGMRFTDFHSGGAMCSPTRASILTGQYPQRFGAMFDGALSAGDGGHCGLPLEAITIAERFQEVGYASACIGKWHLGYEHPFLPNEQGFDLFRGLQSGDGDFHTRIDRSGNEDWWHDNHIAGESGYTTDLLTRHCVEFIEANKERRFFLYLAHLAIHFPWQGTADPPHRVAGKSYHDEKWGIIPNPKKVEPHVVAMIESMDASVGALIEALKANGLEDNTLVVFTSDNGGYLNYGSLFSNISSNGQFRGQKVDLYEGGHRVPFIASWPGRIPAGSVTRETAHSNDLALTFARIADIDLATQVFDGVDLAPVIFE